MTNVKVKDVLKEEEARFSTKPGRKWKDEYSPIYERINSGNIPFKIVLDGDEKFIHNTVSVLRAYLKNNKDKLGEIGISTKKNDKDTNVYIFKKKESKG